MTHWQHVVKEWLFLDSKIRFELLDTYPEMFTPINNASMSSVTYYTDLLEVSALWQNNQAGELKIQVDTISHGLKRALKNLAAMVSHDDKVFTEIQAV